jgi:hypothetical protein
VNLDEASLATFHRHNNDEVRHEKKRADCLGLLFSFFNSVPLSCYMETRSPLTRGDCLLRMYVSTVPTDSHEANAALARNPCHHA